MTIHAGDLPAEILLNADVSPNGEVAWTRSELPRVFQGLLRLDLAVTSAELWFIAPNGLHPDVPTVRTPSWAHDAAFYYWYMRRRNPDEPWRDFVKASIDYAEQKVKELAADENAPADLEGSIYYNLQIYDEAGYK